MVNRDIAWYFEGDRLRRACDKYVEAVPWWYVSDKVYLYELAFCAFDDSRRELERLQAFRSIYDELKDRWRVFDGPPTMKYASVRQIFDILNSDAVKRCVSAGLTLASLGDGFSHRREIEDCVGAMANIKTIKASKRQAMAISKFLHFFNPRLFPIYDTKHINDQVLSIFNPGLYEPEENGVEFYVRYIYWVASVLANINDGLAEAMAKFEDWFSDALRKQIADNRRPKNMSSTYSDWYFESLSNENPIRQREYVKDYYAAAFEIVAIGAYYLEQ